MEGRKSPELANLFRQLHENDTALGDVVEMGRQVEAVTGHPGWEIVMDLLKALGEKRYRDLLTAEKPLEQADYSYRIGVIKGTETALYAAETVQTIAAEIRQKLERQAAETNRSG